MATLVTNDVGIGEETHDLADGVGLADVGQELVAQTFSLASTLNEACDINELDRCRHDATRIDDIGQCLQALVGNVHDAYVGVDSCERIVRGQAALARQGRKEGRLAHVGQAHDTNGKCHALISKSQASRLWPASLLIMGRPLLSTKALVCQ